MANFENIIQWILWQEDSHTDPGKTLDEGDGAGLTRLGLTQRWHQNDLPMDFFSAMSFKDAISTAKMAYKKIYWTAIDGDQIIDDQVAALLLSFSINDSVRVAVKTIQAVLGQVEDGVIGPHTIAEINSKDPRIVAKFFRAEWLGFYHRNVQLNPNKQKFLEGWINRVNFPYPAPPPYGGKILSLYGS